MLVFFILIKFLFEADVNDNNCRIKKEKSYTHTPINLSLDESFEISHDIPLQATNIWFIEQMINWQVCEGVSMAHL